VQLHAAQFALLMLIGADCLARAEQLPLAWGLGYVAWAMLSLVALCAWLEGRRRAPALDLLRLGAALAMLLLGGGWFGAAWGLPVLAAIALLLVISIAAAIVLALRRPRPAGATPA